MLETLFSDIVIAEIISMIFYTFLAAGLMGVIWKLIDKATPFCTTKEIEEDQNIALAVLVAGIFISMAIVIAAVILS